MLSRNMVWLGQQQTHTHTHRKAKANNIIYGLSTKRETIKAAKKASKKSEIQPEWTQLNQRWRGWGGRDPKANKLVCKSGSRLGHQSFRDINGQQSLDSSNNGILAYVVWEWPNTHFPNLFTACYIHRYLQTFCAGRPLCLFPFPFLFFWAKSK